MKMEVKFIDVDWGGLEGQVCYPAFLNYKTNWPVPDPTGQVITQDQCERQKRSVWHVTAMSGRATSSQY